MSRKQLFEALFLLLSTLANPPSLSACSCAPIPPICNSLSILNNPRIAVFTGKVSAIYPALTTEKYIAAFRDGKELRVDPLKRGLLRIWSGTLTPSEQAKIQNATTMEALNEPFDGMPWSAPRKLTLTVLENFHGAEKTTFELFTGLGGGDCGVEFQPGENWLIVADQDPKSHRWTTTICSRTRPLSYAASDLATLSDHKAGKPPNLFISGTIGNWIDPSYRPTPGLKLILTSDSETRKTKTGPDGSFRFEALHHNLYRLTTDSAGKKLTPSSQAIIDLTRRNCAELSFGTEPLI